MIQDPGSTPTQAAATADSLYQRALEHIAAGDFSNAVMTSQEALEHDPSNGDYISAVAQSLMPGKGYKFVLKRIHEVFQPSSYLEIGVSKGRSMALADPSTHVVGIDPAFRIDAEICAQARLYPITSDSFFDRYKLFNELDTKHLDLAFIDGLHLFEQVLRDFTNVEKYASANTVVLIHDCYPVSELTAERNRSTNFWTGDVWKIIPCLRRERPDLKVHVIPCRPSGLAFVTGLNADSKHLVDNFEEIARSYSQLDYRDIPEDREAYFATVPNEWDAIANLWPIR